MAKGQSAALDSGKKKNVTDLGKVLHKEKGTTEQILTVKEEIVRQMDQAEDKINDSFFHNHKEAKNNHRVNIRSIYAETHYTPFIAMVEQGNSITLYAKIFFEKPMFKKIEFLAQLHDMGFIAYMHHLIEMGLDATINNNAQDLGEHIRKRILEEAHDLGEQSPAYRSDELKNALDKQSSKE